MSRRRAPRRNTLRARYERPVEILDGATRFNDEPGSKDPVELLRDIKCFPQFLEPIRAEAAAFSRRLGRRRGEGDWVLLYIAYVFSGETAIQSFLSRWKDSRLWDEAGFRAWRPCHGTVSARFQELEAGVVYRAVRECGDLTIQQAMRHDDGIGLDVGVDATSFQANARLRHCCPDRDACRALPERAFAPRRADASQVEEERRRLGALPDEDDDGAAATASEEDSRLKPVEHGHPMVQALIARDADHPDWQPLYREEARYYIQRGHLFRLGDGSAGARRYAGRKFWLGGLLQAIVDVRFGAPLVLKTFAADEQEGDHYPILLEGLEMLTGRPPDRVSGDKALSHPAIFMHNTERGIASVFPWRATRAQPARDAMDFDEVDRHGVPRCRHCGGPGDTTSAGLGFHITGDGGPVITFRCMLGINEGCGSIQQISCRTNPRMLVPLSRMSVEYHAMSIAGKHLERVWGHWRRRYGVAGQEPDTRTYRRESIPCQRLRAQTARLIEWFRILLRLGWLAGRSARRRTHAKLVDGSRRLGNVLRARDRARLSVPYGRYAVQGEVATNPDPPPPGDDPPPDEGDELTLAE